jgi:hypothetical protein
MDAFHADDFAMFQPSMMDMKAPLPMIDHDTVTSLLTPPCSPPGSPARSLCPSPSLDMLSASASPMSTPPCSPELVAIEPVDATGFDVSDILSGMDLDHFFSTGRSMTPPPEMLHSLGSMMGASMLDMASSYSSDETDAISFVEDVPQQMSASYMPSVPPMALMEMPAAAAETAETAEAKAPKRRRKNAPGAARVAKVSKVVLNKRDSHNVSERQRRAELKKSFEALRKQVPEIADIPKAHTGQILRETISYVNALRQEEQAAAAAKAALLQENARLRALIAKRRA